MIRVRRHHFRRANTRPAVCAYRPYTRLITIDEAMRMYSLGIDIGEIHRQRASDYDQGWADGHTAGWAARDDQANDDYDRGYNDAMVLVLDEQFEEGR